MKYNPFNFKTFLPLDIQMLADGGEGTPPGDNPPPEDEGNGQGAILTLESVQSFLNDNDEGKKWLQSFSDTRVTDAIKTYETKTLPKKLEDEISKRYPPESEEAKQLRELKAQFEQSQKEAAREKLVNQALSTATEKSLPSKLVEFFVGDDSEKTTTNLGILEAEFNAAVQAEVDKRFKDGGTQPPQKNGNPTTLSKEAVLKMTPDEINANWDEIVKNKLL
ncbi:DUF4355 domain-containing protein [Lysinibacillus fusiformis]|uniref:DUF4355 domain-containing protein n=1 Tax=Lysinibacillus fusiformis TaxID=28031 RepID=UPI002D77D9B3|nr:DUF4355 domain-containing protein [Lysinibacillus fusiformis]WRS97547.1 DUF4355 domain-containing protein [Lysinibacillus fusiformis]